MTLATDKSAQSVAVSGQPEKPPVPEGHVRLTIDGIEVIAPKNELVIRAAERIGIAIPRFCDHPLLDPVGACRQCLVEVEMGGRAMPKPQASCTQTVADGMVVKTQLTSPVADKAQRSNLEFLLLNHPLDCPICDKGGECPLQNQTMSNGYAASRLVDAKRVFEKPIAVSTEILLDRERCVLCQRCTRFSEQIAGDSFIDLLERGSKQQIGIGQDAPFQSYFSGNTIQICPVGALTSAAYRFRARPFDLVSEPSVCEHCASGCALRTDHRAGAVTRRLAGNDSQVNEEWNCDKGRFGFTYLTQGDRLTTPLIRRESGELEPASWTEAMAVAAKGLLAAREHGGVGVLAGGRLTVTDAYAYGKFARLALRTNDIDFRARYGTDEEQSFLAARVAGRSPDTGGVTYADLDTAATVLLIGLEPEEESPILFLRLRKATRGALRVFSVAPMASRGLRKLSGTLLPAAPGSEGDVVAGLRDGNELGLAAESVILVGERAAQTAGLLTAVGELADATGARIGWVPRRAGER
ncbi:MAG: NADH-quinone oxidoreductase subunit G, partial [Actinomycetota bacterium]|nr:NADH-quinone oxidoreductase subunit G [Actinomycetota bacterium]